MFRANLRWTPRPVEEQVVDYSVMVDGVEAGKAPQPTDGSEVSFDLEFEQPGVKSIVVVPNGPYGPGPASNEVKTPVATGGITDLRIGNITISVSAQAQASVTVEGQ